MIQGFDQLYKGYRGVKPQILVTSQKEGCTSRKVHSNYQYGKKNSNIKFKLPSLINPLRQSGLHTGNADSSVQTQKSSYRVQNVKALPIQVD